MSNYPFIPEGAVVFFTYGWGGIDRIILGLRFVSAVLFFLTLLILVLIIKEVYRE